MTVGEFLELSIDTSLQKVILFDTESQENFFEGTAEDAMEEYYDLEIGTFDIIGKKDGGSDQLVLNVEREAE